MAALDITAPPAAVKPWYGQLYVQVLIAIVIGILFGLAYPGAATADWVNPALVPGMAISFGIEKFMSECRALTNIIGNGVAAVVISWWEGELDRDKLERGLRGAAEAAA